MINHNKLPSIKDLSQSLSVKYNKNLGQNFIFDLDITSKIVSFAGDLKGKHVIEIGPGLGSLTRPILDSGVAKCTSLEKDNFFAEQLSYLKEFYSNLEIINIDALAYDFSQNEKNIIIANLPYNISSQILYKLFSSIKQVELMVLMFQKEVAERITAKPGNKEYGKLSILTKYLFRTSIEMELPPEVFTPSPKVYSSIVLFKPNNNYSMQIFEQLNKLLTCAFSAKRKMLKNNLQQHLKENVTEILKKCNINEKARPEDLSLEEYLTILKVANSAAS